MPPDAFSPFDAAVARWVDLGPAPRAALRSAFERREAAAREPVALPGTATHEVLFVERGLLRFYYPGDEGRESNKAFVVEGEFAGALGAARLGVPVLYGVEALEPTRYLAAQVADLTDLMEREPALERFGRRLAEEVLARKERRTRSFLLQSADGRYDDLQKDRPDLVQRVPLYHLASYLGVTDVHLSRIRRRAAVSE